MNTKRISLVNLIALILLGLPAITWGQAVQIQPNDNGRSFYLPSTAAGSLATLPVISPSTDQRWKVTVSCGAGSNPCLLVPVLPSQINNTARFSITAGTSVVVRVRGTDYFIQGRGVVDDGVTVSVPGLSGVAPVVTTVALLGTAIPSPVQAQIAGITDGASSTDCTVGGGSTKVNCQWNGTAWVVVGGAGGGSAVAPIAVTAVNPTTNLVPTTSANGYTFNIDLSANTTYTMSGFNPGQQFTTKEKQGAGGNFTSSGGTALKSKGCVSPVAGVTTTQQWVATSATVAEKLTDASTDDTISGDFDLNCVFTPMPNATFYDAGVTTGSANAYVGTITSCPTAYITNAIYSFTANFANTGAATYAFCGLAAKTIKNPEGGNVDLVANDIRNGQIVLLKYNGTTMQAMSKLGNAAGGGASKFYFGGPAATCNFFSTGVYAQWNLYSDGVDAINCSLFEGYMQWNATSSAKYAYVSTTIPHGWTSGSIDVRIHGYSDTTTSDSITPRIATFCSTEATTGNPASWTFNTAQNMDTYTGAANIDHVFVLTGLTATGCHEDDQLWLRIGRTSGTGVMTLTTLGGSIALP